MATDFSEKEREFIDSLEADTGRSLAVWMSAIAGQNLAHRNDIIDWLRRQGFLFSKASWLERIHHNGGRPIYSGTSSPQPNAVSIPLDPTADLLPPPPSAAPALGIVTPQPRLMIVPAAAPSAVPSPAADLDALLSHAKAYKPLAQYILREIATAIPAATFSAREGYVAIALAREFAILTMSPRELRLGLALGSQPALDPLIKARFPKPLPPVPAAITQMVVLTDARQVTDALLTAIAAAAAHNP